VERASDSDPKPVQATPRGQDDAPATEDAAPPAVSNDPTEASGALASTTGNPPVDPARAKQIEDLMRGLSERMRREREQGRVKPAASIARAVGPTVAPPRVQVDTAEPAVLVSHSVISGTPPGARVSASERELETVMSPRALAPREEPLPVPELKRPWKRWLVLFGIVLVALVALGVRGFRRTGRESDIVQPRASVPTAQAIEEPRIPPVPLASVAPPATASPSTPAPDVRDPPRAVVPASVPSSRSTSAVTNGFPSTRASASARGIRSPPPSPSSSEDPNGKHIYE